MGLELELNKNLTKLRTTAVGGLVRVGVGKGLTGPNEGVGEFKARDYGSHGEEGI